VIGEDSGRGAETFVELQTSRVKGIARRIRTIQDGQRRSASSMNATVHNRPAQAAHSAFVLGLVALLPAVLLEETPGPLAALLGTGTYFLVAQFFLSRGNPHAFLDDAASIAALASPLACVFFVVGEFDVFLLLIVAVASSYGGRCWLLSPLCGQRI
jgi:hypothetical protein